MNMLYKCVFLVLLLISLCSSSVLSKSAKLMATKDTVCNVWVWFKDKQGSVNKNTGTSKAMSRRLSYGYVSDETDLPVNSEYIKQVVEYGAKLRHINKWDNAASFSISSKNLNKISLLACIKEISIVNTLIRKEEQPTGSLLKTSADTTGFGLSYEQFQLLNIPEAHNFLVNKLRYKSPGDGVLMAFFDTGFRFTHNALSRLQKNNQIVATHDFIDNDSSVSDPDSVANNPNHPSYKNDTHGSQCLGLVGGLDPGNFVGVAWGAKFVLARTENTFWDSTKSMETEIHSEEDDWASAVMWAESLGVDIVSSSLGYRDGFQDSVTLQNSDGTFRTLMDYSYADLDGKTTIISRAAKNAAKRGMIIVSAMGNEGSSTLGTLTAPADVEDVISVGSVNGYRDTISYFSSTGPTADGRIKPDLVAQGESVHVPALYGSPDRYMFNNGTSFAAPTIAGVCALILQAAKNDINKVKKPLFVSCKLLPSQTARDNFYGYGLPDAYEACRIVAPYDTLVDTGSSANLKNNGLLTFSVYPNVIKPGVVHRVSIALQNHKDTADVKITVVSSDGNIVWKKSIKAFSDNPVITMWECTNTSGKKVTPGIYYAILEYKGNNYRKKILIAG